LTNPAGSAKKESPKFVGGKKSGPPLWRKKGAKSDPASADLGCGKKNPNPSAADSQSVKRSKRSSVGPGNGRIRDRRTKPEVGSKTSRAWSNLSKVQASKGYVRRKGKTKGKRGLGGRRAGVARA